MEYKLVRSNRKTLSIKIDSFGTVIVNSPKKCSLKFINDFLTFKQNWIKKHCEMVKEQNKQSLDYLNLKKILIFGTDYEIINNNNHYKIGDFYVKHTKASKKDHIIKMFLNKLARDYIVDRTKELASMLNLKYKSIQIISARKKWGSCNSLGVLKFNFRLVMLPKFLIDYVICHELCHLRHLNHSKEFWEMLALLGFEKTKIRQQMKPYGFVLNVV